MSDYPYASRFAVIRAFPEHGRSDAEIIAELDAMAREDFATALRLLETIETLPRNVHPGNLPSRLALVRQKLAGQ